MVTEDPIDIWNINVRRSDGSIKSFGQREGADIEYKEAVDEITKGQDYILHDEDGNSTKLTVNQNGIISTVGDDSKLNNLRGATNLKVNIIDE